MQRQQQNASIPAKFLPNSSVFEPSSAWVAVFLRQHLWPATQITARLSCMQILGPLKVTAATGIMKKAFHQQTTKCVSVNVADEFYCRPKPAEIGISCWFTSEAGRGTCGIREPLGGMGRMTMANHQRSGPGLKLQQHGSVPGYDECAFSAGTNYRLRQHKKAENHYLRRL